nr:hypothetical protein [Candidatus Cryosericum septentrionale]
MRLPVSYPPHIDVNKFRIFPYPACHKGFCKTGKLVIAHSFYRKVDGDAPEVKAVSAYVFAMVYQIFVIISNTPGCFFCRAVAWTLIEKISDGIVEGLQKEGYKNVRVVDALNPRIYYRSM